MYLMSALEHSWFRTTIRARSLPAVAALAVLSLVTWTGVGARFRAYGETPAPEDPVKPGSERGAPSLECVEAVVNREYRKYLLPMLEQARHRIVMVHFEMNDDGTVDQVVSALAAAAERGVEVTVLLEDEVEVNHQRVEEMRDAGIRARLDTGQRYTHAKLVVVDGIQALVGSTNFSYMSMMKNNEANVFLDHAGLGSCLEAHALALWEAPEIPRPMDCRASPPGVKTLLGDAQYFDTVLPLIQQAQKSVNLLIYAVSLKSKYPDGRPFQLIQALIDAVERGVKVRVILESSDYNQWLNDLNEKASSHLSDGCINVRFDPLDQISHAKLLLVDDQAVVATNNWGHGGLDLYHELAVVLAASAAQKELSAYFEEIWEESSPVPRTCR